MLRRPEACKDFDKRWRGSDVNDSEWYAMLCRDGFVRMTGLVPRDAVALLSDACDRIVPNEMMHDRDGNAYALRDLLVQVPEVRSLAADDRIRRVVRTVLGPHAVAVRGIFFDKNIETNWMVPWHQDVTIAVRQRVDAPGFGPWCEKCEIPHTKAPVEVLNRMLTVRVHLDPCGPENGPLQVIPGSHLAGKLDPAARNRWVDEHEVTSCIMEPGDVLLMRPLLLHASSPAGSASRRRVLHIEYAGGELPGDLEWFEMV